MQPLPGRRCRDWRHSRGLGRVLRGGRHIVEVPSSFLINCQPWDYLVNISRANHTYFDVYPIRLRSRLPRIRIPLKAGDKDAVLDLQAVFNQAYDTGPYPDRVNYQADPVPPLAPDDDAWARQLLQDAGLRVQIGSLFVTYPSATP